MKLLENTRFDELVSALSVETSECRIEARLESYSCKLIGQEKRLLKILGGSPNEREILAPPTSSEMCLQASPQHLSRSASSDHEADIAVLRDLRDTISKKTLFYLTATLNASFPDYDFSDAKGEQFNGEPSVEWVSKRVDAQLSAAIPSYASSLRITLWASINDVIQLNDAAIYSYNSDFSSDPFSADGALWSFNYFFYNKKLKRIVFFSCRALSKLAAVGPDEYLTQWSMEDDAD